jgi:hypothetical protein
MQPYSFRCELKHRRSKFFRHNGDPTPAEIMLEFVRAISELSPDAEDFEWSNDWHGSIGTVYFHFNEDGKISAFLKMAELKDKLKKLLPNFSLTLCDHRPK